MGLKVNGEPTIAKMDVLRNGMVGGVAALPGGGLGEESRVFACTDDVESLKALVRRDKPGLTQVPMGSCPGCRLRWGMTLDFFR